MDSARLAALLPPVLAREWGLREVSVSPLGGGMNSATALVRAGAGAYVAKWVPDRDQGALLRGVAAAQPAAEAGIRSGPAVPAAGGVCSVELGGGVLVLLVQVPGEGLTGHSAREQHLIAGTLAAVHGATALGMRAGPLWEALGLGDAALDAEPWVGPAVGSAVAAYTALPPLTWALLHTDPAPEAFLLDDATGAVGLVDWAGAVEGPVLYDVASAVMYLGGPPSAASFLSAYAASGVLPTGELDHVAVLLRLRWAVQAAYFAGRLARGDRTGLEDESGNRIGLDDARRRLTD